MNSFTNKTILTTFFLINYNIISIHIRYIHIEVKEVVCIGYNGFLIPHSYLGGGLDATPEYSCGKKENWLSPIRAFFFNSE